MPIPGFGPKVIKHCPSGHEMPMTAHACPRCDWRAAQARPEGRDMTEQTVMIAPVSRPAPVPEPVAAPTWTAMLTVTTGPVAGQQFALEPGRAKLGKQPREEAGVQLLVLADPFLSRDHLVLDVGPAAVIVRDLESTNGSFVHGQRVDRAVLHDGDAVRVGQSEIRVQLAGVKGAP